MKRYSRLLLIPALALCTSAFAQLTGTITVQRNFSVPPNAGAWSDVNASCPTGYVALSGGLDNLSSTDLEMTASAPTFGGSVLLAQADGVRAAPDGWYASVINYGNGNRVVMVTAICAPVSGVVAAIGSVAVAAGTGAAAGSGLLAVSCPNGQVALGGGVDVSRPEAMKLISSSPYFGGANPYLADRTPGSNPAGTGWTGVTSNQGQVAGTLKVAAICAAITGVTTLVSSPVAIAPGQENGVALTCPGGSIATGGGLDSADLHALIATISTPVYNGYAYPAERESGDYPAPAGWFADAFSHASTGNRNLTVGLVCVPVAVTPAGTVVIVYEFYNTNLKHYFRTSSAAEGVGIDNGAAGPGWVRTGDNFTAYTPGIAAPGSDVCRFYTFGANSHFYTAFADECAGLKSPSSGWVYEGLSFRIQLPSVSNCPVDTVPVYRLYNDRFAFNDSNHRFTTIFSNVGALQAQGWQYEGIAFCALNFSGG
ncbi:MAG: hypothetical protein KAX84_06610 [Burkholderiales bacterium]|nr:hypothetical protein [Burkholderiales bacterium]